jgi:alpha-glucosidase
MENGSVEGIHAGFLLPWALLNSWAYFHYPAFQGGEWAGVYRDYSNLRMRLLPFLYSLAERASRTGHALARPLFLAYPEAEQAYHVTRQFLLGDSLLASVYEGETLVLPPGRWLDWWTGQVVENAGDNWAERIVALPTGRGGHLLQREGTLVPLGEVIQYVGEREQDALTWRAFPAPAGGSCEFAVYLDDGDTLGYRKGAFARVTLRCETAADGGSVLFTWGAVEGAELERAARLSHAFEVIAPTGQVITAGPVRTGEEIRVPL